MRGPSTHEECCPVCRGSGQGQSERSKCYSCNGTGSEWVEYQEPDGVDPEEGDE